MKVTLILAGLLPALAVAQINKYLTPDQAKCERITKLNRALATVANQAHINKVTDKSPGKAHKLQEDAATAEVELAKISKNETLMVYCATYSADRTLRRRCNFLSRVERIELNIYDEAAIELAAKRNKLLKPDLIAVWNRDITKAAEMRQNETLIQACATLPPEAPPPKKLRSKGDGSNLHITCTTVFLLAASYLMLALI